MKRNHRSRKPRLNPFQTSRDNKMTNQPQSIEEKQAVNALQSIEKMPLPQHLSWHRAKSFKQDRITGINLHMGVNYSFMDLGKEMKSKRSLIDENIELKKKLQSLSNIKANKRQPTNKKISTEFEKEIYWNGSQSHMISGVKYQYQKIKESYLQKCEQLEELLRSMTVSSTMQFLTYIEALELENHNLVRKMQTNNKSFQNKSSLELEEMKSEAIKDYKQKFDLRLQKWKEKLKVTRKENKSLKNKIMFLQKLLIEKDNNEHNEKRNAKRFAQQKSQLEIKCKNLESTLKNMNIQNAKILQSLKINHALVLAQEQQNQINYQKQQQQYIHRLQKENRYLQNLVESWKEEKNPRNPKKQSLGLKNKMEKAPSLVAESPNQKIEPTTHIIKKAQKEQVPDTNSQKEESQTQHLMNQVVRTVPYTADKKNSQHSVKNRRVHPHQIQQSIDYARCILIAKGLNVEWVVKQFQGKQDEWSKKFISMKQTKEICEKSLQLSKNQAHIIARYLIQDSIQEHVYTDDINEHDRTIVKSIIKNLLGNYSVYQKEKESFQKTLQEWKSKLQSTMEKTTKGQVISKEKFTDIIKSLNLNTAGFTPYCVSKMALHSQSLEKLKYSYLFCQINKQ